ncbi:MAG: Fe-S-binding domain-containing protein, partial [Bacteroidetes bacterium]|nr:Fe-S-binding domain-containing protein [Bacteroidota bacterium]
MNIPYLTSIVIFLPLAGAVLTMLARSESAIKWSALGVTTVTFLVSIGLWLGFDPAISTAAAPQLADLSASFLADMFDVKY